jgi:hypothetical protein
MTVEVLDYTCPVCGRSFEDLRGLSSHRRWHTVKRIGPGQVLEFVRLATEAIVSQGDLIKKQSELL